MGVIEVISREYNFDKKIRCTDIINVSKGVYEVSVLTSSQITTDDMYVYIVNQCDVHSCSRCSIDFNDPIIINIDYDSTIQLFNHEGQSFKFELVIIKTDDNFK